MRYSFTAVSGENNDEYIIQWYNSEEYSHVVYRCQHINSNTSQQQKIYYEYLDYAPVRWYLLNYLDHH